MINDIILDPLLEYELIPCVSNGLFPEDGSEEGEEEAEGEVGEEEQERVQPRAPGAPLRVELAELHPDPVREERPVRESGEWDPEGVGQERLQRVAR